MDKKLMIVDDDKEFLEELNEIMALSGYDVTVVNDSCLALEAASKLKPDVILLDLKMPHKSGFQVADELKHYADLVDVPIIAMSAFFKEEYRPLMHICGIQSYLKKPFAPLDIINKIEGLLLSENHQQINK